MSQLQEIYKNSIEAGVLDQGATIEDFVDSLQNSAFRKEYHKRVNAAVPGAFSSDFGRFNENMNRFVDEYQKESKRQQVTAQQAAQQAAQAAQPEQPLYKRPKVTGDEYEIEQSLHESYPGESQEGEKKGSKFGQIAGAVLSGAGNVVNKGLDVITMAQNPIMYFEKKLAERGVKNLVGVAKGEREFGQDIRETVQTGKDVVGAIKNSDQSVGSMAGDLAVSTGKNLAGGAAAWGTDLAGDVLLALNRITAAGADISGVSDDYLKDQYESLARIANGQGTEHDYVNADLLLMAEKMFDTSEKVRDWSLGKVDNNKDSFTSLLAEKRFGDALQLGISTTMQSLPDNAVIAANKPLGTAAIAIKYGNRKEDELLRESPAMNKWKRILASAGTGVNTAVAENFFNVFEKIPKGTDLNKLLGQSTMRYVAKKLGKELGTATLTEGLEEVAETGFNEAWYAALDWYFDEDPTKLSMFSNNKTKEDWRNSIDQLLNDFIGGAIGGFFMGGGNIAARSKTFYDHYENAREAVSEVAKDNNVSELSVAQAVDGASKSKVPVEKGSVVEQFNQKLAQLDFMERNVDEKMSHVVNTSDDKMYLVSDKDGNNVGYIISGENLMLDADGQFDLEKSGTQRVSIDDGRGNRRGNVPLASLKVIQVADAKEEREYLKAAERARLRNEKTFQVGDKVYLTENGQVIGDANPSVVTGSNAEGLQVSTKNADGTVGEQTVPHEQAEQVLTTDKESGNVQQFVNDNEETVNVRTNNDGTMVWVDDNGNAIGDPMSAEAMQSLLEGYRPVQTQAAPEAPQGTADVPTRSAAAQEFLDGVGEGNASTAIVNAITRNAAAIKRNEESLLNAQVKLEDAQKALDEGPTPFEVKRDPSLAADRSKLEKAVAQAKAAVDQAQKTYDASVANKAELEGIYNELAAEEKAPQAAETPEAQQTEQVTAQEENAAPTQENEATEEPVAAQPAVEEATPERQAYNRLDMRSVLYADVAARSMAVAGDVKGVQDLIKRVFADSGIDATVTTQDEFLEQMKKDGVSEKEMAEVRDSITPKKKGLFGKKQALTINGFYSESANKVYVNASAMSSATEAIRIGDFHERTHQAVATTKEGQAALRSLMQKYTCQDMRAMLRNLTNDDAYDYLYAEDNEDVREILADEVLAHLTQFSRGGQMGIDAAMKKAGIADNKTINSIKKLYNGLEQRNLTSNPASKRKSGIRGSFQRGTQNDENYSAGDSRSQLDRPAARARQRSEEETRAAVSDAVNTTVGAEMDVDGHKTGARFSTSSVMQGAGFRVFNTDDNGNETPIVDAKGNVRIYLGDRFFDGEHLVTADDLRNAPNSILNWMIKDSQALGIVTDKQVDTIYKKYAGLINYYLKAGLAKNGGYDNLAEQWQWLGETVYRTVAENGDKQYSFSIDITRVCKKNEAVIKAISALQRKLRYGITPAQIMDIYLTSIDNDYQVPCPVCYVFSRYIRNGKYATAAINGMRKYGEHLRGGNGEFWTVAQWEAELARLEKENKTPEVTAALKKANDAATMALETIDYLGEEVMEGKPSTYRKKRLRELIKESQDILDSGMMTVDMLNAKRTALRGHKKSAETLTGDKLAKKRATIATIEKELEERVLTASQRKGIERKIARWEKELNKDHYTKAEIAERMEQIKALDQEYKDALEVISQQSLTNWIKSFAIHSVDGENQLYEDTRYPEDMTDFEDNALDLRLTANTKQYYPAIQRLRKSGGAAAGKEVTFASNNELGEVPMVVNTGSTEKAKNYYLMAQNAKTEEERNELLGLAQKKFYDAHVYAQQQSLRGGQRMWSWSDNIERLSPDVAINLMQLELLGGALQSYSKQVEGINLVARLGGYVNGSLMGKGIGYMPLSRSEVAEVDGKLVYTGEDVVQTTIDKNGKEVRHVLTESGAPVYEKNGKFYTLIFDDVVGIDYYGKVEDGKRKKGLRDLNDTLDKAGNIMVGMNDIHVEACMADDRVFFIIPWHASGQSTHILAQMLDYLGVNLEDFHPQDYTDVQEEKDALQKDDAGNEKPVSEHLIRFWEEHDYSGKYTCGISGGVESGSNGQLSDSQRHYRELRNMIFDGTLEKGTPEYAEVMRDAFLKQVYKKVNGFVTEEGKMTNTDKGFIYPYEYWDETSTYKTADVNSERYLEYCRRLGYKPKFVGRLNGTAEGDFGNFGSGGVNGQPMKGYWKLLIDRRMYKVNGEYQDLTPTDMEGFREQDIDPVANGEEFVITRVADEEGIDRIVDQVMQKEQNRYGGIASVNYDLDMKQAVDAYNKTDRKALRKVGKFSVVKANNDVYAAAAEMAKQDYGSGATSINGNKLPAGFGLVERIGGFVKGGTNLDMGGGRFDNATEMLAGQDVENLVFDPYNRSNEHNQAVAERVREEGVDTAICNNCLNVINTRGARSNVILQCAKALKPGGTAYFTIYEGNGSGVGKVSKNDCWQENRKTADYLDEIREHFGKVEMKGKLIIASEPKTEGKVSIWNYDATGNSGIRFSTKSGRIDEEMQNIQEGAVGAPFKNYHGTTLKRGGLGMSIGKNVGSQLYVHKDYAEGAVKDAMQKGEQYLPEDFEYNTVMWDKNKPNLIRYDEAPNFDSVEEPVPGRMVTVDTTTGEVVRDAYSDQIWHHKWMWVGNDYEGFDVKRAYAWSKVFANAVKAIPSGSRSKWNEQLRAAGLDNGARFSATSKEAWDDIRDLYSAYDSRAIKWDELVQNIEEYNNSLEQPNQGITDAINNFRDWMDNADMGDVFDEVDYAIDQMMEDIFNALYPTNPQGPNGGLKIQPNESPLQFAQRIRAAQGNPGAVRGAARNTGIRFDATTSNFPTGTTLEEKKAIDETLHRYLAVEPVREVIDIVEPYVRRVVDEFNAATASYEEFLRVKPEYDRRDAERSANFKANNQFYNTEEGQALKEELQALKKRLGGLRPKPPKSMKEMFRNMSAKMDNAIKEADILDNSKWNPIAKFNVDIPEVTEWLKSKGWDGKDNFVYATEWGFVSHRIAHHPNVSNAQYVRLYQECLTNPDVIGVKGTQPDGLCFIKNGSNGIQNIVIINVGKHGVEGLGNSTAWVETESPYDRENFSTIWRNYTSERTEVLPHQPQGGLDVSDGKGTTNFSNDQIFFEKNDVDPAFSAYKGSEREAFAGLRGYGLRFSVYGKRGAANLDIADDREKMVRMDNLDLARQYEKDGKKGARTIKAATGWERGADGLWRYEMPDGKFADFDDMKKELVKSGAELSLEDVWKDKNLFRAYPELKGWKVKYETDRSNSGSMAFDEKTIYLNLNAAANEAYAKNGYKETGDFNKMMEDEARRTFVHEIQHAIQHIEGFAQGGSKKQFSTLDRIDKMIEKMRDIVYSGTRVAIVERKNKDGISYVDAANEILEEWRQEEENGPDYEDYGYSEEFDDFENAMYKINTAVRNAAKKLELSEDQVKAALDVPLTSGSFGAYMSLAGETESRNVENRIDKTDAERRESTLESTEDIKRKNQIIREANTSPTARFSVTKQQDAEYMDAVNNGDMEKAAKMVREAAAKAMPDTKVVDKDGNPKTMYHGTNSKAFYIFNHKDGERMSNGFAGVGYWFSDSKDFGLEFAKRGARAGKNTSRVMDAYLDMKNPLVYEYGTIPSFVQEMYDEASKAQDRIIELGNKFEEYDERITRMLMALSTGYFGNEMTIRDVMKQNKTYAKLFRDLGETELDNLEADIREYRELDDKVGKGSIIFDAMSRKDPYLFFVLDVNRFSNKPIKSLFEMLMSGGGINDAVTEYVKKKKEEGFDGIVIRGTEYDAKAIGESRIDQYAVFDSEQIKSADPVTYDENGNVIPLSERFNPAKKDIRFSAVLDYVDELNLDLDEKVQYIDADLRDADSYTRAVDIMMDAIDKGNKRAEMLTNVRGIFTNELKRAQTAVATERRINAANVKALSRIAQSLNRHGWIDTTHASQLNRLLGAMANQTGDSLEKSLIAFRGIVADASLKKADELLKETLKVKPTKLNSAGVEVQGDLDIAGQTTIKAFRDAMETEGISSEKLQEMMADLNERIDATEDEPLKADLRAQWNGLYIAQQYMENVIDQRDNIDALVREYTAAKNETLEVNDKLHRDAKAALLKSMLENIASLKAETADAIDSVTKMLSKQIAIGAMGAESFIEEDAKRTNDLHHKARREMQGLPNRPIIGKASGLRRLFDACMSPARSFESVLRYLGYKSPEGEGELFDHFMGGWIQSRNNQLQGVIEAMEEIDRKVYEIFYSSEKPGKFDGRHASQYAKDLMRMPGAKLTYLLNGKAVTTRLSQDNLAYIYMVSKMEDGRMKLAKMGITPEKVEYVTEKLDPKVKKFCDWIQQDFLVKKRNKYNEVHMRMFGAPMGAIENYFPLKIDQNARKFEDDLATDGPTAIQVAGTTTGAIKKRTKNSVPLDIRNAGALSETMAHIMQMEQWAAFAEFNRDVNRLFSFNDFKNKLKSMDTIYGKGDAFYRYVREVFQLAAGTYKPIADPVSTAVNFVAKGTVSGKINFRLYTAFKQISSHPAFIPYMTEKEFNKSYWSSWVHWGSTYRWAYENLPIFRERVSTMDMGDYRLEGQQEDFSTTRTLDDFIKRWMQACNKAGMAANRAFDSLTCAMGAKGVYDATYAKYKALGLEEDTCKEKAQEAAVVAYNKSQQSNEQAFVSTIQRDKNIWAFAVAIYRNSPIAYTRNFFVALNGLKKQLGKMNYEMSNTEANKYYGELQHGGTDAYNEFVEQKSNELFEERYEEALAAKNEGKPQHQWRDLTDKQKEALMDDCKSEASGIAFGDQVYKLYEEPNVAGMTADEAQAARDEAWATAQQKARTLVRKRKDVQIEYLQGKYERMGVDSEKAAAQARSDYKKGIGKNVAGVIVYGYVMNMVWRLFAYIPYLALGDDKDKKKDLVINALTGGAYFSPITGLVGGSVLERIGDGSGKLEEFLSPSIAMTTDFENLGKNLTSGKFAEFCNDLISVMVQSGTGFDPNVAAKALATIYETWAESDDTVINKAQMTFMALTSIPKSQQDAAYFDQLLPIFAKHPTGNWEDIRKDPDYVKLMGKYKDIKMVESAPMTFWARTKATKFEKADQLQKNFNKVAKERYQLTAKGKAEKEAADAKKEAAKQEKINKANNGK